MIHKYNKIIFFQLFFGLFFFNNFLQAITVNDKPLRELVKPGENLFITPKKENNFVAIEIKNNNVKTLGGDINMLRNLEEAFKNVVSEQIRPTYISGSTHRMSAGDSIEYGSIEVTAQEKIFFSAKNNINISNGLFNCKDINFICNELNLTDCFFINPGRLHIGSKTPDTDCLGIIVSFNNNSVYPTVVTGSINFLNNETSKMLIFSNVKEICIAFSEKVLNS